MLGTAHFTGLLFFGHSLTSMTLYIWARRNQDVRMSLFGLFTFNAPYFPWVMLLASMALGSSPKRDLLGIVTGHIYFYFDDVLPRMMNGQRYLRAPALLKRLFGELPPATPVIIQPAEGALAAVDAPMVLPQAGQDEPEHAHIE